MRTDPLQFHQYKMKIALFSLQKLLFLVYHSNDLIWLSYFHKYLAPVKIVLVETEHLHKVIFEVSRTSQITRISNHQGTTTFPFPCAPLQHCASAELIIQPSLLLLLLTTVLLQQNETAEVLSGYKVHG